MNGDKDEVDDALIKWRADSVESDDDTDGASAESHDKLQRRVAEDEKRRKGK